MANRQNALPRPAPGDRGPHNGTSFPAEKTAKWPGAAGPKGPQMNRTGGMFHEVKVSAAQDMNDDIYGHGPAIMGAPLPAMINTSPAPAMINVSPGMIPHNGPVPALQGGGGLPLLPGGGPGAFGGGIPIPGRKPGRR